MISYFAMDLNAIATNIYSDFTDVENFNVEGAVDGFTYTWWKSAREAGSSTWFQWFLPADPPDVNFFAVAAHNLDNSPAECLVRLQGSHNNVDWVEVARFEYPHISAPLFKVFDAVNYRYYRFLLTEQTAIPTADWPYIGYVGIGQALELPAGIRAPFVPPFLANDDMIYNSMTATGHLAGRSYERQGLKIRITQENIDPEWIRANWQTIMTALFNGPVILSVDYEKDPGQAVLAWLDNTIPNPIYSNPKFTRFNMDLRAMHDTGYF